MRRFGRLGPPVTRPVVLPVVLAVAGLVLAGCGTELGSSGGGGDGARQAPATLDGAWVLTSASVDGTTLDLSAGRVTLAVDGAKWGGQSACNHYFADVTRHGDGVALGPVGGTEMACDEPQMTLEGKYWNALPKVTSATRGGDSLVLSGDGVTLIFGPVRQPEISSLIDTTWTLTSLLEGETASSVIARPSTLTLHKDGRVTGSTGCRQFFGRWSTEGEDLVIGPLDRPRVACRGAALQDEHVLGVLDGRVTAAVVDTSLTVAKDTLGLTYADE